MGPILSICILTYNRANYLQVLLDSIYSIDKKYLDQIEVVVINNGSTDETHNILSSASTFKNFSFSHLSENKRGSSVWLELVSKARGEFIIFPGDDDQFITKGLIDLIEACNKAQSSISLIAFGAKTIDSEGKSNFYTYAPPDLQSKSELIAKLLFDSVFWMPATAVRRSLISKKYDPLTITAFDWWIWLTASCYGDVKYIELPLVNYRQHIGQEQKSFLKLNWEIDSFLMLRKILEESIIPWLSNEKSESKMIFFNEISNNLKQVSFDQYQILKWTMIISIFSQSFDTKGIMNQTKLICSIWNDPRFVETWFNFELTTEQILGFYNSWGISTSMISNTYDYSMNKSGGRAHEQKFLKIYKNEKNEIFTYTINLALNGSEYHFSGLNEPQFRSKLKELFSYILVDYREIETINQVTPMERKILQVYRKLKTYKLFNLVR